MRILLFLLFSLLAVNAQAQNSRARVVATCGTPPTTYTAGGDFSLTQDTNGKLCTGATVTGAGDATAANQATANASLSIMDDWDDGADSATVVNKPTATATYGITPVVSSAAEGSHVLKAGAGNLYGFSATTGASAGYVMVFNATSAPADGAVTPVKCYIVPAGSSMGADFRIPEVYSTGITVVFSTTGCFTKTVSATAFFSGVVK